MDEINYVLLASRWIHIAAATVAIGGMVFTRFVLLPSAQETLDDAQHDRLRAAVRKRWARFVYGCITLLLISGTINLFILVIQPRVEPMPYHAVLSLKVLASFVLFFFGSALAGKGAVFASMRANLRKWLGVALVLAALIVTLSGMLGQVRAKAPRRAEAAALTSASNTPAGLAQRASHP